MLPKLESIEGKDGFVLYRTTDHVTGIAVEITAADVEDPSSSLYSKRLGIWLKSLNPKIRARFNTRVEAGGTRALGVPRADAIQKLGYREFKHRLCVEIDPKTALNGLFFPYRDSKRLDTASTLIQALRNLEELSFRLKSLDQTETEALFVSDVSNWVADIGSIETGTQSIGVVRLVKPTNQPISSLTLARMLSRLLPVFEVRLAVERMNPTRAEVFLQRRLRQASKDHLGEAKTDEVESALLQTSLNGQSLLQYEFLVIAERVSKVELKAALGNIAATLKGLGDIQIETIGAAASLTASMPGSTPHVALLDTNETLPCFIPVFREGETVEFNGEAKRALTVHREDQSLCHIDLLDRSHQNANAAIIGASGRGKSVFLGSLTSSLLNDSNVSIIKVDVGGSHSRECSIHGGTEYRLNISEPSGLNPFALVTSEASEFERAVLGQFLEVLILEEGEKRLSKAVRAELDQALQEYLQHDRSNRTLDDFVLSVKVVPRRHLLERWTGKGLYGNAFRERQEFESPWGRQSEVRRLIYLNFSEIFQASDPEFAQAAMAAVLAIFNLEMKANPDKRLVLVCDETPFFIERCFEFFRFSTANVRKFGASVILVVQLSRHLVVGGDTSILDNSHHRFLFSSDGEREGFIARLNITDEEYDRLSKLQLASGKHSQLLYQEGQRTRVLKLELTKEEYWQVTSTQSDRIKLENLMRAVPGLKTEEAIKCLSLS